MCVMVVSAKAAEFDRKRAATHREVFVSAAAAVPTPPQRGHIISHPHAEATASRWDGLINLVGRA